MKFKFSFHSKELSGLKGLIAERLVRTYLDKVLIPKLKNEFDFVFAEFTSLGQFLELSLGFIESALLREEKIDWEKAWKEARVEFEMRDLNTGEKKPVTKHMLKHLKEEWKKDHIKNATIDVPRKVLKIFLERGVFPEANFFDKTLKLLSLLTNAPDGIIFKLNKTGVDLSSYNYIKLFSKWNWKIFDGLELQALLREIPVVSGEMEVIEIKADRAFIMPHQAESYKKVIAEGYPLRYFHVTFISFEKNQFEIKEKLVKKVSELEVVLKRHLPNIAVNNLHI